MSGKDKLLDRIKSDCDAKIAAIEKDAQAECDKILKNADSQIKQIENENSKTILAKIARINAGTKSKVDLEIRNTILKKRREEINLTVDAVKDRLLNADDKTYFENIYRLASTLSGMEGVIYLNEKDLKRLPSDFESRVKESGLNAACAKESVDIDGGFILKNGDIEENMAFSAIISARYDELEDLINRELFRD